MTYSFRAAATDEDAIAKIRLDRGGISISDAFRVALHECASRKPQLTIAPSVAPPKEFASFKKSLEAFSEDLLYVAETGLPKSTPDTAPEDLPVIATARKKFQTVHAKIDRVVLQIELLSRLIAALDASNIDSLRYAMWYLQRQHDVQSRRALDPKLPTTERTAADNWVRHFTSPILSVFRAVGIAPTISESQKPNAPTESDGA